MAAVNKQIQAPSRHDTAPVTSSDTSRFTPDTTHSDTCPAPVQTDSTPPVDRTPHSDEIQNMVAEIPALRRFGRVLAGTQSGADDLVQDTLERAIQKFHLYQPGTKLRLWLFTIMRNLFLDHYRKQRKMTLIASEMTHRHLSHRMPDQFDKLVHNDLLTQLNALKPEYRELLMLVGVQGLSYEQAAEMTGVPLGTVRSRLFRARNLLAQMVEGREATGLASSAVPPVVALRGRVNAKPSVGLPHTAPRIGLN